MPSGPAGGIAGSVYAVRLVRGKNLIPFDMGGTNTDISPIVDGQPSLAAARRVAAQVIALNGLDIANGERSPGSLMSLRANNWR
jgi:N-methylhydantoinase A